MEAWQRAGHLGEARRVAKEYLARYPQGPQAARARQLSCIRSVYNELKNDHTSPGTQLHGHESEQVLGGVAHE